MHSGQRLLRNQDDMLVWGWAILMALRQAQTSLHVIDYSEPRTQYQTPVYHAVVSGDGCFLVGSKARVGRYFQFHASMPLQVVLRTCLRASR